MTICKRQDNKSVFATLKCYITDETKKKKKKPKTPKTNI